MAIFPLAYSIYPYMFQLKLLQLYFPRGHVTLQMDLNICTVSLSTRDVTIEVRCRAHSLPHNPLVHIPIVTLNDLEIASFIFVSKVLVTFTIALEVCK